MINMQTEKDTIYITAEGKLNDDDYDLMLPALRKTIDKHGKVNWFFRMKNFEGWTLSAFWRDLQFDVKNRKRIDHVAVVGEQQWQKIMTEALKPFVEAEIKYFDESDNDKALDWVAN